jgi:hypothetical protein
VAIPILGLLSIELTSTVTRLCLAANGSTEYFFHSQLFSFNFGPRQLMGIQQFLAQQMQ